MKLFLLIRDLVDQTLSSVNQREAILLYSSKISSAAKKLFSEGSDLEMCEAFLLLQPFRKWNLLFLIAVPVTADIFGLGVDHILSQVINSNGY